jgi:hypothetical protein
MLDVYQVVKCPVSKDSHGVVAVFGNKKMEFAGISMPETTERRAFLFGKRLFEQFLCKVRMVAVC